MELDRLRLARAAARLNEARGSALPHLVLMTDDERLPDPVRAAAALPPGSMIVLRSRQSSHRAKLARRLCTIARVRRLKLLIANDPELARRVKADGVHFSEANACEAAVWRVRQPNWLITAAAHSLHASLQAQRFGVDAVLLAPVFATGSHAGRVAFGAARARAIVRQLPKPIYALGGISSRNMTRLADSRFAGLAAIGALTP